MDTHASDVTTGNVRAKDNESSNPASNTNVDRLEDPDFERAGRELLSAISAEECSTIELSLAMNTVPRVALLTEALTQKSPKTDEEVNNNNMPLFPCIAWTYGPATPPQLLNKAGLSQDLILIKPGTHAFVKMPGESSLRVSVLAFAFGRGASYSAAAGHSQMSGDQPVEAAGEVEINAAGQLVRWNNLSSTYKVSEQLAFQAPSLGAVSLSLMSRKHQPPRATTCTRCHLSHSRQPPPSLLLSLQAGLPLDKFWAVLSGPGLDEDPFFVHRTAKVNLIKVFQTDEGTFIDAVKQQQHLGEGNGHHRMVQERLDGIRNCGYLSQVQLLHR